MNNGDQVAKKSSLLILSVGALMLFAGSLSAKGTGTTKTDRLCPTCRAQTRVMPLTGMPYTDHSCPSCRRVSTLDEATRIALQRFMGETALPGDTVHTCGRCGTTADCPICRKEMN